MDSIDDLIQNLSSEAAAIKQAPRPLMLSLGWIAAASVFLTVSLWVSGVRSDVMQKFYEPWFDIELGCLLMIFLATTVSAAVLAFPDLYQKKILALSPLGFFLLFVVVLFYSWRADSPPAPFPVHRFECTCSITLFSFLPAVWTFYSMRKYASTHYRWAGSIALLSAFSMGAIWLRLHEVNDSVTHVIEWHYLPMLGIGLVGWWLGGRVLKW